MVLSASVAITTLLQLTKLASEVAIVVNDINSGKPITVEDWDKLRIELHNADARWEDDDDS